LSKLGQYENSPSQFSRSGIDMCEESDQKSGGRGEAKGAIL
jgi:hypothetical protein